MQLEPEKLRRSFYKGTQLTSLIAFPAFFGLARKDETWKASVGEPIRSANGKKFYELFDEGQRNYILKALSAIDLEELSAQSRMAGS